MATVTFIKYAKQSAGALGGVAAYVAQKEKTVQEDGRQLVSGQNCNPQLAFQEFLATRTMHRKESPVWFYHYVQSFAKDEPVTGELAHEVAKEFAARAWPESEVLIATHIDREHIHSHFIVNSVCFDSGQMLRQGPSTLATLRPISDEICMAHGLSVLPKQQQSKTQGIGTREYRAAAKGESWKFRLMNTIDDCMKYARTREEFISLMKSEGYGVRWEDSRQSITYTLPSGYKCRDDRLHDEKYLKESMEHEFGIRQRFINGGIEATEYAGELAGNTSGAADVNSTAGGASDGTGVADAHRDAGRFDLVRGETEPTDGTTHIPTGRLGDEGAGGSDDQGVGGNPYAARTGWEAERSALFAPAVQSQIAAPVPSAAIGSGNPAGTMGSVVKLGHALECVKSDFPVMDATTMHTHTDSKTLKKQRQKKIAQGHAPDDHEEKDDMQMRMQ